MLPAVRMFRDQVVRPVLQSLALDSPAAELLMLGTAAQESNFKFLEQISGGPGIGLFQMEPRTYHDIWDRFLATRPVWNARAREWSHNSSIPGTSRPIAAEMAWNLRYAAAMARIHYYRVPEALPVAQPEAVARYWKRYYNTIHGSGSVEQFVKNLQKYVL